MDIEGADVLPAKLIEDEFKDQYGQPLNFARVEKSRHTIDNWYRDRYLDGMVIIFITPNVLHLGFPKRLSSSVYLLLGKASLIWETLSKGHEDSRNDHLYNLHLSITLMNCNELQFASQQDI